MVNNDPLIEIIIPNWNGERMLAHCLSSLRQQTSQHFSITVVDNGSRDGSVSLLEKSFPEVKLIKLDRNTGFSFAVNKGIEDAQAPWLLLLNNDMEVAPDCLENLARAIETYGQYDFFALKMMNYHQRDFIDGAGDAVFRGGVGYRLGTMEQDNALYRRDRETFGACAGAALYRRDFFTRVGLFDPDFFAYLEDVDLNMRARRIGLRCMYIASAIVFHIGSASSGSKINELTIRLSTKNNINVLVKNYTPGMFLRFLPAIAAYQGAWAVFCLKKRMIFPYFTGLFQAIKSFPHFYGKRRTLFLEQGVIQTRSFREMIKSAEKEAIHSIMVRRRAAGKGNFFLHCYSRVFF
jgi:GT2 family glycosyltransferase